jgi:hypothetical protein
LISEAFRKPEGFFVFTDSGSLNRRFNEPEIRGKQPINSDKIQILTALI